MDESDNSIYDQEYIQDILHCSAEPTDIYTKRDFSDSKGIGKVYCQRLEQ